MTLGAERGERVLLVDLAPQASLSISAQVDVLDLAHSIYDVLQAAMRVRVVTESDAIGHRSYK